MTAKGSALVRLGGADRDRTDDLLHAMQALFQLSYGPITKWTKKWVCGDVVNLF